MKAYVFLIVFFVDRPIETIGATTEQKGTKRSFSYDAFGLGPNIYGNGLSAPNRQRASYHFGLANRLPSIFGNEQTLLSNHIATTSSPWMANYMQAAGHQTPFATNLGKNHLDLFNGGKFASNVGSDWLASKTPLIDLGTQFSGTNFGLPHENYLNQIYAKGYPNYFETAATRNHLEPMSFQKYADLFHRQRTEDKHPTLSGQIVLGGGPSFGFDEKLQIPSIELDLSGGDYSKTLKANYDSQNHNFRQNYFGPWTSTNYGSGKFIPNMSAGYK